MLVVIDDLGHCWENWDSEMSQSISDKHSGSEILERGDSSPH